MPLGDNAVINHMGSTKDKVLPILYLLALLFR